MMGSAALGGGYAKGVQNAAHEGSGTVHAGLKSFSCPTDTTPRTLAARTATINAYYVCGPAGSFTPPDNFGCVTAIQHFPGDARDGYEPNRPFTHYGF
jgi:hypothetical protein